MRLAWHLMTTATQQPPGVCLSFEEFGLSAPRWPSKFMNLLSLTLIAWRILPHIRPNCVSLDNEPNTICTGNWASMYHFHSSRLFSLVRPARDLAQQHYDICSHAHRV